VFDWCCVNNRSAQIYKRFRLDWKKYIKGRREKDANDDEERAEDIE